MTRPLHFVLLAACAGREPDHATVWVGDGQAAAPVMVASSTHETYDLPVVDAAPPLEVGNEPPEGLYAVTVEAVSDDCKPKRPTFEAGIYPLTASRKAGDQYYLTLPYPTTGRNHVRTTRSLAVGASQDMPYAFYASCVPTTKVDRSFIYEGGKGDSFTMRAVEYWPDVSRCPQGPEDVPNPVKACRSERRVRYRLISACNAPCKQQMVVVPFATPDGGGLDGGTVDGGTVDGGPPSPGCKCP